MARHRAMKKQNEETKKEYNALNASYIANHRIKLKVNLKNIIRKMLNI